MAKNIAIADYIIKDLNDTKLIENMILNLSNLRTEGNEIYIIDGKKENYNVYGNKSEGFNFVSEDEFIKIAEDSENSSVFVSEKDSLFKLSTEIKSLFVTPMWTDSIGEKAEKYGVKVDKPRQMYQIIKHSNNNNFWHSWRTFDDETKFYSLLDAKFRYFSTSTNEEKMIDNFLSILHGNEKNTFFDILKYDILSALSNNLVDFGDIDIWTVFPKSNATLDSKMTELKDAIETSTGLKDKDDYVDGNLLVRYKEKDKAHMVPVMVRYDEGAKHNLETIHLNPDFKDKIEGATICVIDDFQNHGFSFEAARNLLKAAGAKQVVLLALGVYQNDYIYEDYKLEGDLYSEGFSIDGPLKKTAIQNLRFKINPQAKVEVETLFNVFNPSW